MRVIIIDVTKNSASGKLFNSKNFLSEKEILAEVKLEAKNQLSLMHASHR